MENQNHCQCKTGNERRVTLKMNNCLTNDPCAFCGGRCDPFGLDFFAWGTEALICEPCAQKYAPEIVEIQKAACDYANNEKSLVKNDLQEKVKNAINEPLEMRILRAIEGDFPF